MSRILILDDEPQIVRHCRLLLRDWGHEVAFLSNTQGLMERLTEEHFDLLLIDYHLNGTDALDVLNNINALNTSTPPVLVMTGDHDDELLAKCFDAGAKDFINKPISGPVLKSRVESILSQRRYLNLLEHHRDELDQLVKEKTRALEQSHAQLLKTTGAFQKFVPKVFADHIWKQQEVSVGYYDQNPMTIIFIDILGYTKISENMPPKDVLGFLNQVFACLEAPLKKHQGIIEKFMGDGLMVLFPVNDVDVGNPIDCAIDIQKSLKHLNLKRQRDELPLVELGIGINTGPVVLGALGTPSRFNSTVIGDAVNLASRIESSTRKYSCKILISSSTLQAHRKEGHLVRLIDRVRVKGKSNMVSLYEIFNVDGLQEIKRKFKTVPLLERIHRLYQKREFSEAIAQLKDLVLKYPGDEIVLTLLRRCSHFMKYPPHEQWDGAVDHDFDLSPKRKNKRFEVSYPPENINVHSSQTMNGIAISITLCNVSREGLKIITEQALTPQTLFNLNLTISRDHEEAIVNLLCHCVWTKSFGERHESGCHIIFSSLEEESYWIDHLDYLDRKCRVPNLKTS